MPFIFFFSGKHLLLTYPLCSCGFEGAIELSILADYYGREIAAYDIQTTRCDLYGQVQVNNAVEFEDPLSRQLQIPEYLFVIGTGNEVSRKGYADL